MSMGSFLMENQDACTGPTATELTSKATVQYWLSLLTKSHTPVLLYQDTQNLSPKHCHIAVQRIPPGSIPR